MGFQECKDPVRVFASAGLLGQYQTLLVLRGDVALCAAFRSAAWVLVEQGNDFVAEDSPAEYYGKRMVQWLRLRHLATGSMVFFANHHGPLPVNSGGVCGGRATARGLVRLTVARAWPGDVVLVVGDFNANNRSETVEVMGRHLQALYRGVSFGGVDNVFSNLGPSALVGAANLGSAGSDHDALSVVLEPGSGEAVAGEALRAALARREVALRHLPFAPQVTTTATSTATTATSTTATSTTATTTGTTSTTTGTTATTTGRRLPIWLPEEPLASSVAGATTTASNAATTRRRIPDWLMQEAAPVALAAASEAAAEATRTAAAAT
eukprot:CAMPEP_0168471184 /NCGR_PEP_ID=MMETSP0228-20121227/59148_1 /TAXON_ID=133427 /ORGANISM="Protoceratium reticulatum, Strain CCCM 535 (=CCMP 1889)" /LENGTH=323 /DNA_ID=CAMNT_0008487079 /DNA_START=14 /DNA_END=982 /DNA_ORIENTATION=-